MVEELLPATITLVTQVDVNEGIVLRPDGLLDEHHARLFRSSAAFSDVAFGARTDNIVPNSLAAHAPRGNVVKRELAGRLAPATILAPVFIASEDVSAIKLDFGPRQTVVK